MVEGICEFTCALYNSIYEYRPTSWEIKETLEREERDSDVIRQFGQSMVDKMMSILEAEAIYEQPPSEAAPNTCAANEEQEEVWEEQELYEDLPADMLSPPSLELHEDLPSPTGLVKEERAKFCFKNTKVCVIF